jgi:hypothetical protein
MFNHTSVSGFWGSAIDLAPIVTMVGVFVSLWAIGRQRYSQTDNLYSEILKEYLAYPGFADPEHINPTDASTAERYPAFARMLHTFLETIVDCHRPWWHDEIEADWSHVFDFELRRHRNWLETNSAQCGPKYLAYARERLFVLAERDAENQTGKTPPVHKTADSRPKTSPWTCRTSACVMPCPGNTHWRNLKALVGCAGG